VTAPSWATVLMSAVQEGDAVLVDKGKKRAFTWKQAVCVCVCARARVWQAVNRICSLTRVCSLT
jgi:hypothetical protein